MVQCQHILLTGANRGNQCKKTSKVETEIGGQKYYYCSDHQRVNKLKYERQLKKNNKPQPHRVQQIADDDEDDKVEFTTIKELKAQLRREQDEERKADILKARQEAREEALAEVKRQREEERQKKPEPERQPNRQRSQPVSFNPNTNPYDDAKNRFSARLSNLFS